MLVVGRGEGGRAACVDNVLALVALAVIRAGAFRQEADGHCVHVPGGARHLEGLLRRAVDLVSHPVDDAHPATSSAPHLTVWIAAMIPLRDCTFEPRDVSLRRVSPPLPKPLPVPVLLWARFLLLTSSCR